MNDRVPVKIYPYDHKILQELEIGSGKTKTKNLYWLIGNWKTFMQSKEIFHKLRKCEMKVLKYSSTLQFKCDNFILGCTVGFQAILNQKGKEGQEFNCTYPFFKRTLMWRHILHARKQEYISILLPLVCWPCLSLY